MPNYRDDSYRHRRYDDKWDDEYFDDDDWDEDEDDDQSRALIAYDSERSVAISSDDISDEKQKDELLIIPGGSISPTVHAPRRRRSSGMNFLLIAVAACITLSALFSISPIGNSAGDTFASSFTAVVNAVVFKPKQQFVDYIVRSGDTFDSIASAKGIQLGGIFEANHFMADAEAQVGQTIQIPTDPNYGQGYSAPLPAGMSSCGYANVATNIPQTSNAFLFCSVGGQSNDNGVCPANYLQANGDPSLYDLGNPENGQTYHFVRGFTAYHSGVDMSTGQSGTPLFAVQDGEVIYNNYDAGGGGYSLKINLCGGIAVSYSHMVSPSPLAVGATVRKGDKVGDQGSTGQSSGPHLHFMLWWDNVPIDPLCGYQNLVDGYGIASPHVNGCPPNIGHKSWP
jgi:murein DD-endopeptidase MepM/ murein hydrolase activator NlpD